MNRHRPGMGRSGGSGGSRARPGRVSAAPFTIHRWKSSPPRGRTATRMYTMTRVLLGHRCSLRWFNSWPGPGRHGPRSRSMRGALPSGRRCSSRCPWGGSSPPAGSASSSRSRRRPERPPRRVLARHQGQRLDRRQGRGLGARPLLARRPRPARLPARRPRAQGQGQAIRRLHPRTPAAPTAGSGRSATRPEAQALRRLAALPPVQGPDPVPGGHRRSPVVPALLKCCRKIDQVIDQEAPL